MIKACKKCRREGEKLLLKGERCISPKCAIIKRSYAPGQHGQRAFSKTSEYGRQLREKQKAKRIYGLREEQFSLYAQLADKLQGNTPENLLALLEIRIDNVIYRTGLARSRSEARQMVSHGWFKVNNKKVTIPSYRVAIGDVVAPKEIKKYKDIKISGVPSWITFDPKKIEAKINQIPGKEEIDTTLNANLIIEYYSR